jgi:3',5'-cyclic AMP phosphodiesterase CpdA
VSEFTFVHASDTHIAPAVVERTRRFRALVDSLRPAFALIAGDLIRDAMSQQETVATSYYDLFLAETGQFTTPLWMVPGNHENFGIIRSRSNIPRTHPLYGRGMYHHYLGPDYYSFTWGGVHFVGLNSVSMDDSAYYGYVDSVQMAWLERDLAQIPRTMPVVTFNHIPLVSGFENLIGYVELPPVSSVGRINGKLTFRHTVSNVGQVMDLFSGRPYPLALGAHIHAGERLVYETTGRRTRFEQSAAIVGPGQLGTLTFPSGFTLYTVRNGEIDAGRFIPLTMESSTTP